jgi:soluble lytic murein transglycosylase-like protein
VGIFTLLFVAASLWAYPTRQQRIEAEHYVEVYAGYYHVPVRLVRSIIQQESGWNPCAVSFKGAVGLMQLMPETARILGVHDRCNIRENISGGVRYLAWLLYRFHGDTRLAVAAYYVGERAIEKHGLNFSNPDVVAYVYQVRSIYTQMSVAVGEK